MVRGRRSPGIRNGLIILVAVLACLLAACQGAASPALSTQPARSTSPAGFVSVVLGIYSGRADPGWTLSADQASTLDAMLAALPLQVTTPPGGGLGYHGFIIQRAGSTLVAYLGSIAPAGEGSRAGQMDPARSVERFLLGTGRAHLDAVEIAAVEAVLP